MHKKRSLGPQQLRALIVQGTEQPIATTHYPSRGQTAVQKLYQTKIGKLFLKQSTEQNHRDCQIDIATGTLAEREYWAYQLAHTLGLHTPTLWLLDRFTTVQTWLDYPDGRIYSTYHGVMRLHAENIFDCALFDWLTGQIDRHDANYLYNFADQEIILIDSAHGFLTYDGSLPDYLRLFEVSQSAALHQRLQTSLHHAVQKLQAHTIGQSVSLRTTDEHTALLRRLAQVQQVHTISDIIRLYRGAQ